MATLINTKIGTNKGLKRIWMEGERLNREGYEYGKKFIVSRDCDGILIRIMHNGTHTVSKRSRGGNIKPIIDLSSQDLLKEFNIGDPIRIVIKPNFIKITPHEITEKIQRREISTMKRIKSGEALRSASLCHGSGILDRGLHEGFKKNKISTLIGMAIEIEGAYIDVSLKNNSEIWDEDSIAINSPIELVNCSGAPEVDFLVAGMPCTGASKTGKAKNKLKYAEDHISAGAVFHYVLNIITALNPSFIVLENVTEYANTASMAVIRSVLSNLGYTVDEFKLSGGDFGALEDRERLFVFAHSTGFNIEFNPLEIRANKVKEACLGEILESVPCSSPRWKTFDYLAKKEISDKAKGKGFRRQLLDSKSVKCGVAGRGYAKCRSTEPFIKNEDDIALSRIFTAKENAAVKTIPEYFINGLFETLAHEILGQSGIFECFKSIGEYVSKKLNEVSISF